MGTAQRCVFCWIVVAMGLPAWAEDSTSPRVTRNVKIIREIEDGVVAVFSQDREGKLHSGSGSIIHPAGFVLTNDHVVRDFPGVVLMKEARPLRYETVGRLPEKDLAVLRIKAPEKLTVIPLGHSDDLMTGEPCLCGGNPGGRGIVFTSGIVSSAAIMANAPNALVMSHFAGDVRDRYVQFDAASNPGNSGGPLVNAEGRQIAVVCSRQLEEENINYAIPIDRMRQCAAELIAPEITRDLFAGLTVDCLAQQARVETVAADSPAHAAGIRPGDVLSAVDGAPLRDGIDWLLTLASHRAGDELALRYRRGEEVKDATVKLARYPVEEGIDVKDVEPGLTWKLYTNGKLDALPNFDRLKPSDSGVTAELKTRELSGEQKLHFALRFEGLLKIEKDGLYRLILASDDGSRLDLHGRTIIDNDGPHPRQELGCKVRLGKGCHPLRVDYFEATGDSVLELFLEDAAGKRVKLGAGSFFHRPLADKQPEAAQTPSVPEP